MAKKRKQFTVIGSDLWYLVGLITSDGCIRQWIHPTNFVEQWTLRVYSGSRGFLVWLKNQIETLFKVKGKIYKDSRKRTSFILKYGKLAAKVILKNCYYKNIFSLGRKAELAGRCVKSYEGWEKSKAVFVSLL